MKKLVLSVVVIAALAACNNADSNQTSGADSAAVITDANPTSVDTTSNVPDMHNAENALDYEGTYSGTVPCASCEGIETTIVLNKDKTFTLKEVYKGGKEPGTFENKGTYSVDGNIATLKFAGAEADRSLAFHVGENQLFMLDAYGNKVEGELANNYILKKK